MQVYDRYGELVGLRLTETYRECGLKTFWMKTIKNICRNLEILSQYINLDIAEVIESEDGGPGILLENGKVVAIITKRNCETMIANCTGILT